MVQRHDDRPRGADMKLLPVVVAWRRVDRLAGPCGSRRGRATASSTASGLDGKLGANAFVDRVVTLDYPRALLAVR